MLLLLFLQNGFQLDWSATAAGLIALVSSAIAVWGQVRTKKLEAELNNTQKVQEAKNSETQAVISAYQKLVEHLSSENLLQKQQHASDKAVIEKRLEKSEAHTEACERQYYKLVIQLIQQGVQLDTEKTIGELEKLNSLES